SVLVAVGAGAGLMVISNLADFASKELQLALGHLLVAALALGNGIGRIITGTLSDLIGRRQTLLLCFLLQMALMLLLSQAKPDTLLSQAAVMAVLSALIGANFGANLALFPAVTKDYYGLKHFGANYGMMFTAYGVGGFGLSLLAGKLYDLFGTYTRCCYVAAVLLLAAAVLTLVVRPPKITADSSSS
ncbi:MAG TPA: MFS transporter, partial [Thermoguttaceae bacterium]|nr:MFS transporter [Thermoguttaceae bacterium]